MIVYVDDMLMTCMDEASMAGVLEALKDEHHNVFIADVLKNDE